MTVLEKSLLKITCPDLDDPAIIRTAQISKALGHPVRLTILKLLSERENCFCGDFTDVLPLAQSTVSQHLKVLKDTGLITGTNRGVRTCYCLNRDGIDELNQTLETLSDIFKNSDRSSCC